jgi:drug/metabolite transporter (DMT)-like permease
MPGEQSGLVIPAFAALAAAGAFGVAAALQHRQTGQVSRRRNLSLQLLADVARRPLWLAAIALAAAAYGLQALALAYGPLTLVAPIIAADLLFALPLAARWSRHPLRARDWGGCLLVGAGVAVFLSISPRTTGRRDVPAAGWIAVFAIVVTVTVLAVVVSRVTSQTARARLLAAAAGMIFGLTAAVTASFTRSLRQDGLASALNHWQPWALVSLGIAGILLSTGAFQAGALSASLPVIDTVEPVSGVIIGAVLFNERLSSSPAGLIVQLGAAVVAVTGIAMLGPSLAAVQAQSGRPRAGQAQSVPAPSVPAPSVPVPSVRLRLAQPPAAPYQAAWSPAAAREHRSGQEPAPRRQDSAQMPGSG